MKPPTPARRVVPAWLLTGLASLALSHPLPAALRQDAAPPQAAPPAAASGSQPATAVARLDDLLAPIREEHRLPALAAAVTRGSGLVAIGASGKRRLDGDQRVTIDDSFHIGSCTKSMTATLCAILVDEGKLRWDMTIAESFPALKDKIRAEYLPVTLEQLLQHRSGLPEDRNPGAIFAKLFRLKGEMREKRLGMVELALNQAPEAEPGRKMAYSNFGYAVAGAMCEQATGKAWEDLMRERLFIPLGMKSAGFGPPGDAKKVDQPFGHRGGTEKADPLPAEPGPFADNPAVIGPGGTVHCSLGDWAKYAALHLRGDGKSLGLKPGSIEKLHESVREEGYSFGWGHSTAEWHGADVYQHAGSNTMWFALIQISPKRNLAVLVATNCATPAAREACDAAAKKLAERFDRGP